MKTKIKSFASLFTSLAIVLAAVIAVGYTVFVGDVTSEDKNRDVKIQTVSDDTERIVIASSDGTEYEMYFSSDAMQADQTLASDISKFVYELYKVRLRAKSDAAGTASDKEVLIGSTNRQESAQFLETLNASVELPEDLAWGYAVINGKLIYNANNTTAFDYGAEEFISFLEENDFTVDSDLFVINVKTRAEYDAEMEADEELKRQMRIKELIAINSAFTQSDFGGAFKEMQTDRYTDPTYYPAPNQHPRLFFTADKIDEIYDNLMNNPDFRTLREKFWEYANAENFTGIFPEEFKDGVPYHFNSTILAQMEAKALAYILTGDEIYGYEAIIGAKNAMLSLHYIPELHMDTYHGASQVMVNVARVYDWCYDLLSEADKNQIIAGVSNVLAPQMEGGMQFPPSGMSAVSGHGTGPQFTRDWVTISLAFYDEAPSWWEFVGGRYFEQYVPIIDYCYQGGYASQGTTTYGDSKYFTKGWAAWLIKMATGEFPYVENFHLGAYYYFSHIQPNGYYFQTGDGGRSSKGCEIDPGFMFISAALFDDPVIANMAKKYTNDYTKFSYAFTMEYTVCTVLIWHTYGPDLSEYEEEDFEIDLIQYLDFPSGTMTARNSWDEDGAAALMRIAEMTMGNHDLNDHGTFQIYYKGLLAGTSGAYKKYGSYVHQYYLQATVAHNGLLIFNPALADDEPIYGTKAPCDDESCDHTECVIDYNTIKNASRYYYSGSQRDRSEAGTIENWLSGEYNMAEVYGADWGYDLTDGSAEFAYIAGDLTNAYNLSTVNYVGRKMLTVFTDDPNYPMLFFTYDQMTSVEGGEHFTKSFLIHTVKEPVIDEENLTAVITQSEGRLFVHSLTGAQNITKIGGEGKAYWVNGKNCVDEYATSDSANVIWGRLELTATGNLSDSFLTAMYVTDATNDTPLEVGKISSESVDGTVIKNKIIAFTKTDINAQQYKEFSFTTEGQGLYNYYVAGIEAGTWSVKVDGVTVATAYSDEGGSIITFTAPTGKVTIVPGKDVIGANGGKIKYNALGGKVPDDAPLAYNNEEITPLPKNIVRGSDTFLGWYTSPTYEPETYVEAIPMGLTGAFVVYARYLSTLINADFTDPDFNLDVAEGNKSNILNFQGASKKGSSFITKTDESGVQYVEWTEGSQDPLINYSSKTSNYSTMSSEDECATFTITLSKNGDETMMASQFRIYTKKTVSGGSATTRQYLFTTNTAGEVRLGDSTTGPLVTTLTSEKTTLKFVMDFKNEEIRAFDDQNNPLASVKVTVKAASEAANMSEWRKLLDEIVLYWYGASPADVDASMRIYGIKIEESDRVATALPENAILYAHDGGELPEDAPKEYSKETATLLPIPTKDKAVFEGWYTSATFDEGTKITEIPTNTEGHVTVYAKWTLLPDDGSIVYHVGSGELPEGAPTVFSKESPTKLPTPTNKKSGYTFIGWFTSPDFKESTLVTEVPTDTERWFEVYAKWRFELYEDFTEVDVDVAEKNTSLKSELQLNATSCPGATFITKTDENGNKYLECYKGTKDPRIILTSGNIAASTNTSVSYEIVIGVNGDAPIINYTFRTLAKVDVNGEKLESNNQLYMFGLKSDGAYLTTDGAKNISTNQSHRFAEFKDGKITVRVEIDFKNELVIGYRDDGTFVSSPLTIPESSGAKNGLEYMKTFNEYVMYLYSQGNSTSSARIYSIKIVDDKIFGKDTSSLINYNMNGGTLPEGAPENYDPDAATLLPTPTKDGATFGGWYTTADFEEGTLISEIPAGNSGIFAVYAKWTVNGKINYNLSGGTLPAGAPEKFDPDGVTVLPIPERDNASFAGWYTSASFDAATRVTEIPAGLTGEYTVWAKWNVIVFDEDYSKTVIDVTEASFTKEKTTYNGGTEKDPREGASFKTEEDESGNKYLVWTNGTEDPMITVNNGAIASMAQPLVSYEIRIRRNGNAPFMQTSATARAQVDVNGNTLSPSAQISLFSTKKSGNVYLAGSSDKLLGAVSADGSEFVIRIVIDFANLKLYGYTDGDEKLETSLAIPEVTGATTGEAFQKLFKTYVLYWQGGKANSEEGSSMIVEGIKIAEGNLFE